MSSKYETAFKTAIAESERKICIDLLRQNPGLTLGELYKLAKGPMGAVLGEISIAELAAGEAKAKPVVRPMAAPAKPAKAAPAAPAAPAKAAPAKAAPAPTKAAAPAPVKAAPTQAPEGDAGDVRKRARGKDVNVRTPAGRAEYEMALLAALAEFTTPTGVSTLMGKVGGTNLQARAALNRLIEAGKITWVGKARGTKYSVVR